MAAAAKAHGRRRSTLENIAFSYAGVAFTIVQGIVLVPIYFRYIPQELYGAWLATGSILAWLELADPGLSSLLQQRIAFLDAKDDKAALGTLIGTGVLMAAALAATPLLAWPLPRAIAGWIEIPPDRLPDLALAFKVGLVGVALSILAGALGGVSFGFRQVRPVGLVGLVGLAGGVAATLGGLALGAGLLALPLGSITRGAIGCIGAGGAAMALLRRHGVRVSATLPQARALLGEASFMFTSRVGVALLSRLDALMSATLLSPGSTVILTLTGRAVDVARLGADRLGAGAMPAIAHLAGERGPAESRQAQALLGSYAALLLGVLGGTAVAWNGPFMRLWVGEERFGGISLTVALAAHGCLASYAGTVGQALFSIGRVRETSIIVILEALARLVLQLVVVRSLGLVGFPLAALGALLAVTITLLSRTAAAHLGGTFFQHMMAHGKAALGMWALLGVGWLVGGQTRSASSWPVLAAGSLATAAVLLVVALTLFPAARQDVARYFPRRRAG